MTEGNELAGKVAVVTGAGRNIGRAIARHLAAAGASVVVNARSNQAEADAVVAEIKAAGGKAIAVLADVGDAAAVEAMAQAALKAFGRIDILVNNASLRREKPIDEMSYADWREIMDATLDSAFHGVHACLPAMKKNGGTIINIGGHERAYRLEGPCPCDDRESRASSASPAGWRTTSASTTSPPIAWCPARSTPRGRALRSIRRIISPTAPSPASPASRTTSPPWCAFLAGPGGRNVTGQTIHVNGGAFLG